MSLAKTLLKVAIGIAIAKGVSTLTKGGTAKADTGRSSGEAGRGSRIDTRAPGGLEDMMGDLLGGGTKTTRRSTGADPQGGGMGDLLDQMSGSRKTSPRKGAPKGGMEDLLGQLTGTSSKATGRAASGGVGDLLDQITGKGRETVLSEPERETEVSAALMLRAMIQAVKSDGTLDDAEKAKLMEAMGDASPDEVQAVNAELNRPVDVDELAAQVPAGLEPQVYLASLMAIDLDQQAEAQYLHNLAQALDLTEDEVNALHDRAGAPRIYR